jgi:hypothetical protein
MTRRTSLISAIVALTLALGFVVFQLVRSEGADGSDAKEAGSESGSAEPSPSSGAEDLKGLGWWPLRGSGTAKAGDHDIALRNGATWAEEPDGGALHLDGGDKKTYANTGTRLDTVDEDYSVAARVRLDPEVKPGGFFTAVSQDGGRTSTFFLQYSGEDKQFAFSFPGSRTVAGKADQPKPGRWYHLVGTYSQKDHEMRVYVDGKLAGSRETVGKVQPTGQVVLGRGKFHGKGADFWRGEIADVHVYDRELSSDEANSLSSGEPED